MAKIVYNHKGPSIDLRASFFNTSIPMNDGDILNINVGTGRSINDIRDSFLYALATMNVKLTEIEPDVYETITNSRSNKKPVTPKKKKKIDWLKEGF